MRREIPFAKKYLIVSVLLIVVIDISFFLLVVEGLRSVTRSEPRKPDDCICQMDEAEVAAVLGIDDDYDEPYSGTITEIETTSDKITHIKVENKEGERWFTTNNRYPSGNELRVYNEVTFRCRKDDPENKIVSVLKNEVPLRIILCDTVPALAPAILIELLILDILLAIPLVLIYRIVYRAKRKEKVIVPVIALCTYLLVVGGVIAYAIVGYIRRAEAAAASVSRANAPVIYLYNEDDTPINVKIDLDGEFTYTYPAYNEECGWTVTASPDGTLTDSEGRSYDFLFWEGDVYMEPDLSRGFCVEGEDTRAFLTDAAATLGLNDNETELFVSYWAPRMEGNPYNVITFQTTAFDEAAELEITPEPDVLLRVNMLWYPSDTYVDIPEQDLNALGIPLSERYGFTAVEWGGEMLGGMP